MASKRHADVDVTITVTESKEELNHIPALKLRIKETLPTSQHVVADISNSLRQNDRFTALLQLSETPISTFSTEDGEQLVRVLKDSLRKEDNHTIRARILLALKNILKIPNLNRLVGVDDLIDPAQKESKSFVCLATHVLLNSSWHLAMAGVEIATEHQSAHHKFSNHQQQ